jgi:hypothetical protein
MSNLPAVRTNFDVDIVNAKINYATQLAAARLLPRDYQQNPGNLLLAVAYAESVGIPTMAAITGLHIMNGKPTASAGLVSSVVRRAGHKLRVRATATEATVQIIRCDDPDFTYEVTWTIQDARDAGLAGSDTWKKYPRAMLISRAITQCAREGRSEALNGVQYTPEELGARVDLDENGEQVIITDVTHQAPAYAPVQRHDAVDPNVVASGAVKTDLLTLCSGVMDLATAEWKLAGLPSGQGILVARKTAEEMLTKVTAKMNAVKDEAEGIKPDADDDMQDAEVVEDQPESEPTVAQATMTDPGFCHERTAVGSP